MKTTSSAPTIHTPDALDRELDSTPPGVRLLLAVPALFLPVAAQERPSARGEPILSRDSALAVQDRVFTSRDVLHMWVPPPLELREYRSRAVPALSGRWRLESATQVLEGALGARENGLGADLDLAAVTTTESAWSWSASLVFEDHAIAVAATPLRIDLVAPSADFAPSVQSGEATLRVSFADLSSGGVTSWDWDFGDGQHSSAPAPEHVYTAPGSYTVRLVVANAAGSNEHVLAEPIQVQEQDLQILYGMNASENVWWQRGIAFADAMARSGEFFRIVEGVINRVPADLIASQRLGEGWPDVSLLAPNERAGTRLFGSMAGSMPDGRELPYVLTWEGTGSCRLLGTPVVSEQNRASNRVEVFVDPTVADGDALLVWEIEASDPSDPVRNAHVWLPGTEADTPILWPPFVEKLQAMNEGRGPCTWRAMDWNEVNQYGRTGGSAPFVFDFAGRITPASPSQGTKRGVCPEYQVALCNAVGANLHFNVPHPANDIPDADYEAFVRDALVRIRDGSPAVAGVNGGRPFEPLAPNLTVTVEFSNEVWNPGFPVNAWLKSRAAANGRTLHQETAEQIRRVFRIADEVFAGADAPRLRKYVGGTLGDAYFLLEVLSALGPDVHVDAVGPACYFGPRKNDVNAWMIDAEPGFCPNCPTPEAVLESARQRIAELDLRLLEHQLVAASHVNPDGTTPMLELYEGGASFAAGFQPWGPAANQAQRLPGMYSVYLNDFVPELITRGVRKVMWYSFMSDGNSQGSAGPFGHWDRMNQTITLPVADTYVDEGAPKAAAIYRLPPRR